MHRPHRTRRRRNDGETRDGDLAFHWLTGYRDGTARLAAELDVLTQRDRERADSLSGPDAQLTVLSPSSSGTGRPHRR